jgi:hypothetical protein
MAVTTRVLVPSKVMEATSQQQYTSQGSVSLIDKFTVVNTSANNVSFSVNIVASGGSPTDANIVIKSRALAPNQTYNCPELVGHVLQDGASIYTQAGTASSLTMRVSGREIT